MSQANPVVVSLNNLNPLLAGKTQSLSLTVTITSGKFPVLFVVIPVEPSPKALMDTAAFNRMIPSIQNGASQIEIHKQKDISGGEATLRIDSIPETTPQEFDVVMSSCEVNNQEGVTTIRLEDNDGNTLAPIDLQKTMAQPEIIFFTAIQYNVIQQGDVTVQWLIHNGERYSLAKGDGPPIEEGDARNAKQQKARVKAAGTPRTSIRLNALLGGKVVDSRQISIHAYAQTSVLSYRGPGDGVLGLYSYEGNLYAIVKLATDSDNAYLWLSRNGFDDWMQLKNGSGNPIRIPMASGESPGVVFQKKLWLMGGSSFDPAHISAQIGYYHFESNTWIGDVGPTDGEQVKWPVEMNKRMGHSIVVSPDGKEIWVIGGYDQSGGARKDIWTFDGLRWMEAQVPPWEPRCLFGAVATADSIWIAGGFESPGGQTYNDIRNWDAKNNKWNDINHPLRLRSASGDEGQAQYCACTAAALENVPYFFTTYYDPKTNRYDHRVLELNFRNNQWEENPIDVNADWALPKDYYSLQSVAYNGCIFIRKVARGIADENIHYFVRVR